MSLFRRWRPKRHLGIASCLAFPLRARGVGIAAEPPAEQNIWVKIDQAAIDRNFEEVSRLLRWSWAKDHPERFDLSGSAAGFLLAPNTPFADRLGTGMNALVPC